MRVRRDSLPEVWSRMRRDNRSADAQRGPESLEDLVYRPRISTGRRQARGADPLVTVPLALAGYCLLGFLGWRFFQVSRPRPAETPKSVTVDLLDTGEGEVSPPVVPAPRPVPAPAAAPNAPEGGSAAGGPPPGAILRPDATPPPLPANPDAVPETPPAALPTQDLSGTAFPVRPSGGPSGTGLGSGPGTGGTGDGKGTGTGRSGTGAGPAVVHYDSSPVREKYRPPDPPYPPVARKIRLQGTVRVEITVGVDGVPISAHATEGPRQFHAASEAWAMQWRFEPHKVNGVPVIGIWPLIIQYRLQ